MCMNLELEDSKLNGVATGMTDAMSCATKKSHKTDYNSSSM